MPMLQTQGVSPQTHHFPSSDQGHKVLYLLIMAIVVGKIALDTVSENGVYTLKKWNSNANSDQPTSISGISCLSKIFRQTICTLCIPVLAPSPLLRSQLQPSQKDMEKNLDFWLYPLLPINGCTSFAERNMIFAGDQHKGGKPPKKHAPSASAEGPLAAVGRPEANLADDPSNRSAREKLRLGLGSEMGDLVNTSTNTNHKIQEKNTGSSCAAAPAGSIENSVLLTLGGATVGFHWKGNQKSNHHLNQANLIPMENRSSH